MLLLINHGFAEALQVISLKMTGTFCTDDTRVKVPSFKKVTFSTMVLLLLTFCLLLLPLWESVIVLCFVVRYFKSILVLQSS